MLVQCCKVVGRDVGEGMNRSLRKADAAGCVINVQIPSLYLPAYNFPSAYRNVGEQNLTVSGFRKNTKFMSVAGNVLCEYKFTFFLSLASSARGLAETDNQCSIESDSNFVDTVTITDSGAVVWLTDSSQSLRGSGSFQVPFVFKVLSPECIYATAALECRNPRRCAALDFSARGDDSSDVA
ncbi:hypothetical protein J6590_020605 [Homalodisca vitripennis]|nr:hypothetical protein J6590_020605 [Homalodisca vitripennis]